MQKFIIATAAGALLLSGCASTKAISPEAQEKIRQEQATYEQNVYRIKQQSQVDVGNAKVNLIFRERTLAIEPELTIVQRKRTAAVAALITVGVVAAKGAYGGDGFSKDDLKGKKLEPALANPILDYAKSDFEQWLLSNHDKLTPQDKPLEKVTVTPRRFVLIYTKLVGKESYELNNELIITLQNSWDNRKAYEYLCDIKSAAKTLPEWQANNYQAVHEAVKQNIQSCLNNLDNQQAQIYKSLS